MTVSVLTRPARRRVISPFSPESIMGDLLAVDTGFGAVAWTQNLAVYVPFALSQSAICSAFFWENGATVAGNSDAAVYDATATTKLATTGSTANSGASDLQVTNITDVILAPGRYWLAYSSDSATHTLDRINAAIQYLQCMGVYQQTSAWSSGLPTTPTFAAASVANVPVFGFVVDRAVI